MSKCSLAHAGSLIPFLRQLGNRGNGHLHKFQSQLEFSVL